jgi:hypothetical protein
MLIQSASVIKKLTKPSTLGDRLQISVLASGEKPFNATYSLAMSRRNATPSEPRSSVAFKQWSAIQDETYSLDGHHVRWESRSLADEFLLSISTYSIPKLHTFDLRLDCNGSALCINDGDSVETVLQISSMTDRHTESQVRIVTQVESLISCEDSETWVWVGDGNMTAVPRSTRLRVFLRAMDVDGLPIRFTRAAVEFKFGDIRSAVESYRLLPVLGTVGSNEYIADIAEELTATYGTYDVIVTAAQAWSRVSQNVTTCKFKVLHGRIVVAPSATLVQTIVASVLTSAAVLLIGCVLLRLWRYRTDRALLKRIFLSVLDSELRLFVEILFEIWGIALPALPILLPRAPSLPAPLSLPLLSLPICKSGPPACTHARTPASAF